MEEYRRIFEGQAKQMPAIQDFVGGAVNRLGLGIFFIRKFMSHVSFDFDPRQGNIVTMRRRLGKTGPQIKVRGRDRQIFGRQEE